MRSGSLLLDCRRLPRRSLPLRLAGSIRNRLLRGRLIGFFLDRGSMALPECQAEAAEQRNESHGDGCRREPRPTTGGTHSSEEGKHDEKRKPDETQRVRHNFNPGLHIHTICPLTRLAGIIRRIARPCQSDLEPKKVERASVRMRRLIVNATSRMPAGGQGRFLLFCNRGNYLFTRCLDTTFLKSKFGPLNPA